MVGRLTLDQVVGVRVPAPQLLDHAGLRGETLTRTCAWALLSAPAASSTSVYVPRLSDRGSLMRTSDVPARSAPIRPLVTRRPLAFSRRLLTTAGAESWIR